jgi:hypothetical protein
MNNCDLKHTEGNFFKRVIPILTGEEKTPVIFLSVLYSAFFVIFFLLGYAQKESFLKLDDFFWIRQVRDVSFFECITKSYDVMKNYYRPFARLCIWASFRIFKDNFYAYSFLLSMLFAAATLLFFDLCRRWKNLLAAFIFLLLFLFSPLYIVRFTEKMHFIQSLQIVTLLISFNFIRAGTRRENTWLWGAGIFWGILACYTKEGAVFTFPLYLLIVTFCSPFFKNAEKKHRIIYTSIWVFICYFLFFTLPMFNGPFWVLFLGKGSGTGLTKDFGGAVLSLKYVIPNFKVHINNIFDVGLNGHILGIALLYAFIYRRRNSRYLRFGWIWIIFASLLLFRLSLYMPALWHLVLVIMGLLVLVFIKDLAPRIFLLFFYTSLGPVLFFRYNYRTYILDPTIYLVLFTALIFATIFELPFLKTPESSSNNDRLTPSFTHKLFSFFMIPALIFFHLPLLSKGISEYIFYVGYLKKNHSTADFHKYMKSLREGNESKVYSYPGEMEDLMAFFLKKYYDKKIFPLEDRDIFLFPLIFIPGTKFRISNVSLPSGAINSPGNLIKDPGFESDKFSGFVFRDKSFIPEMRGPAIFGKQALYFIRPDSSGKVDFNPIQYHVKLKADTDYIMGGWLKKCGDIGGIRMEVQVEDSWKLGTYSTLDVTKPGRWEPVYCCFRTPSDITDYIFIPIRSIGCEPGGEISLDDCFLFEYDVLKSLVVSGNNE